MKQIKCDVCGKILDFGERYKSDIYDYDLCPKHKEQEKYLNMREVYINALKKEKDDE